MNSKLGKLYLKLDRLKKRRYNTRKLKEYHTREREKASKPKDFEKHDVKLRFYTQELEKVRKEIANLKEEITAEEGKVKERTNK
ncbi:MAG: hypothetical protein U9O89_01405 [Thermoproteota archaeon]|nr:hypothetical protein [Thermoproteota archaeon]